MPTGYTAELMEKGMPFNTFVMQCARAFGACVEMRDESLDVPVPDKFEPDPYHTKALIEAQEELRNLKLMNAHEQLAYGERRRASAIRSAREAHKRYLAEDARLLAMKAEVLKWEPPSAEHEGLKKFMLEQIEVSLHGKYNGSESLQHALESIPLDYYRQAVQAAKDNIAYHKKGQLEENKRAAERTKWVQTLKKSLKP